MWLAAGIFCCMFELETKWDGDAIQRFKKVKKKWISMAFMEKNKENIVYSKIHIKAHLNGKLQTQSDLEVRKEMFQLGVKTPLF